nr:transposase [Paraliobacillus ryukyuensis]
MWWYPVISQSFPRRKKIHATPLFNSGYIEGVNKTIKVMKCISYGIKRFERLKKKILGRQEIRNVLL